MEKIPFDPQLFLDHYAQDYGPWKWSETWGGLPQVRRAIRYIKKGERLFTRRQRVGGR